MQGTPGIDFPEDRSPVDVLPASRGSAVMCFVEQIDDAHLILTIGQDRAGRPVRLSAGERMDVVWKDAGELRSLPAELVAVETTPRQVWQVKPVGPAARGQRRAAVRAPLPHRAVLSFRDVTAEGTTLDVSEGGVRALFDLSALAQPENPENPDASEAVEERATSTTPEVGSVVGVTVWFDDRRSVTAQAEVTRDHARTDRKTELSLRFIGMTEKMQDVVRREVFAGLRELHARGAL